jgi:nucleoid-associated protein YgaU
MPEQRPSRGRVNRWRSVAFLGSAIFFLGTFAAHAQDVAEAARQEQARKGAEANGPKHVYTEEDLKKDRILTPYDQARVAARKQPRPPVPAQESADQQQPAAGDSEGESLGAIARRYRNEKEEQQAEVARKRNYTPFRYELTHPAVASPKAGVAAIPGIRPNQPYADLPSSALPPVTHSRSPKASRAGRARVSPFEPRPLTAAPPVPRVGPLPEAAIVAVPQPTLPASRQRAVESASKARLRLVVVQTGDSWWRLASQHLGEGNRWAELRALNPRVGGSADLLRVGIAVLVPEGNKVQVDSPPAAKRIQIRVQRGDTLWSLAREHLGRASAWSCLAGLNPEIRDYGRMAVGTLLQLPGGEQAGVCASVGVGLKK